MTNATKRVFISYTHDSNVHKAKVLQLADSLRVYGIDCFLDQYEPALKHGDGAGWMERQIREADFVLLVCSKQYIGAWEDTLPIDQRRGARWEILHVRNAVYAAGSKNDKFIPVLLSGHEVSHIPLMLATSSYYVIADGQGFDELYWRLTSQHDKKPPTLGPVVQRDISYRLPCFDSPECGAQRGDAVTEADSPTSEMDQSIEPISWRLEPAPAKAFIGRQDETTQMLMLLGSPRHHLISLVAPPCVGKSALALHVAHQADRPFGLSRHRVDLRHVATSSDVAAVLSTYFGGRLAGTRLGGAQKDVQTTIAQMLKSHGPMLLLLDNFENAHRLAHDTVERWLKIATELHCLITSRRQLGLASEDECTLHIAPLRTPTPDECDQFGIAQLREFASVQLFLDRAKHRDDAFAPDDNDIRTIARICEQAGGFPACIELAAAQVHQFTLVQLHRRIRAAALLPGNAEEPDSVARKYLYPALDSMFNSLSIIERTSFLQAATFPGGLTLEAAEAVFLKADANSASATQVWRSLCNASLLEIRSQNVSGTVTKSKRAFLYAPIREYALELWPRHVSDPDRDRHYEQMRAYFIEFAQAQNSKLCSSESAVATNNLLAERDNLVGLLDRSIQGGDANDAMQWIMALEESFRICGPAATFKVRLEKTLMVSDNLPIETLAHLQRLLAETNWALGDYNAALGHAETALDVATPLGCHIEYAEALAAHGRILSLLSRRPDALPQLLKARDMFEGLGADRGLALLSRDLSMCYDWSADSTQVEAVLDEGEKAAKRAQDGTALARILNSRGLARWHDGKAQEALDLFENARRLNEQQRDTVWMAGAITNCGLALTDLDRFDEAAAAFDKAEPLHTKQGNVAWNAVNSVGRARLYLYSGKHSQTITEVGRIEGTVNEVSYPENRALMNLLRAVARLELGELDSAQTELHEAEKLLRPASEKMLRFYVAMVSLADCEARLGNIAAAQAYLSDAKKSAVTRRITPDYRVRYIRDTATKACRLAVELSVPLPVEDLK